MGVIDSNINIIEMIGLIFSFIVAMSVIGFAFFVIKKIFECKDETDFGVENGLIGKIRFTKKPKKSQKKVTKE